MNARDIDIDVDRDGQLHEPWVFLTMLDQMSTSEINIGFIYSVIDLLARRYELTDAVVVLRDEALGTQAFRLGQKSLDGDSPGQRGHVPGRLLRARLRPPRRARRRAQRVPARPDVASGPTQRRP